MSKATKELVATIVMDDRLGDDRAEPGHAIRQPQRHPPAMERQIGASISIGRIVTADEVASVVTFLASPKSVAINGDAISVGGGAIGPIHY